MESIFQSENEKIICLIKEEGDFCLVESVQSQPPFQIKISKSNLETELTTFIVSYQSLYPEANSYTGIMEAFQRKNFSQVPYQLLFKGVISEVRFLEKLTQPEREKYSKVKCWGKYTIFQLNIFQGTFIYVPGIVNEEEWVLIEFVDIQNPSRSYYPEFVTFSSITGEEMGIHIEEEKDCTLYKELV